MKRFLYYIVIGLFALAVIAFAFYAAVIVSTNGTAREFVSEFGIIGIIVVAFISGLNIVVPLHVATFTPIFIEAGFSLLVIIPAYVIGTTLADLVGYTIGVWGRRAAEIKHPHIHARLIAFNKRHHKLIFPMIFALAAFVPLPNEFFLIPLGLIGYRLPVLLPPLILGTIVNHTLYAYGFINIFEAIL